MTMTEEKIRRITRETQRALGKNAHPDMVKKVVKEVVRRMVEEDRSETK